MMYLWLFAGLFLLIIGGNVLVDGSVIVAKRMKVSPLFIGLIFIGLGTSLPELATSLVAVARQAEGIAIGNVIGSNIANLLLVLGVAALIRPIKIHKRAFERDAIFLGVSTLVLLLALLRGQIGWELGALMCMTLAFYVYHVYQTDKEHVRDNLFETQPIDLLHRFYLSTPLAVIATICGLTLTLMGAHILVNSVVVVAGHLGISETIIGLTIVAFGTCVPELVTAIVASVKGQSDMAVGDVFGSNIYNTLFILGFTALFFPVTVPSSVRLDVLVMTAATLLLLAIGWWHGKIERWIGGGFILAYLTYICYLGMS